MHSEKMAWGGLTSQVILKPLHSDGICLLRALDQRPDEISWAERASRDTGLRISRILEGATTLITDSDVTNAPEDRRAALEQARQQGKLVCGRVTDGGEPPVLDQFASVKRPEVRLSVPDVHREQHRAGDYRRSRPRTRR